MFEWLSHIEDAGEVTGNPDHEQRFSCARCAINVLIGPGHGRRSAELRDQIAARKCSACINKDRLGAFIDVSASLAIAGFGVFLIAAVCI